MKTTRLYLLLIIVFLSGCDKGNITSTTKNMTNKLSVKTENSVEMATLSTWDWTDGDSYKDYNGDQIPPPWTAEENIGVDVTQSNKCDPTDGWELLFKRMEAGDYTSNAIQIQSTGPENPYFVLYNKYTGVMRLFMYFGGSSTEGEDYFQINTAIKTSANSPTDVGLFLNDAGNISYPLSEKNSNINDSQVNVFQYEAIYKKWIVIDYNLSYDPDLSTYHDIYMKPTIQATDTSKIHLEGSFNFNMHSILTQQSGQGFIGTLLNQVLGLPGDVKQRMANVTDFGDNIEDIGQEFYDESEGQPDSFLEDMGKSLIDFADLIEPGLNVVGFGAGAIGAISSFTNIFGGGSTQAEYTTGKGAIELNGSITDGFVVDKHSFGLPLIRYGSPADSAELQEKIGLFALKETPHVNVTTQEYSYECRSGSGSYSDYPSYAMYADFPFEDESALKNLFAVNPDSHMELVHVAAVPIIKVTNGYFSLNYSAYYAPVFGSQVHTMDYSNSYSSRKVMYNTSTIGTVGAFNNSTKFTIPIGGMRFSNGYLMAGVAPEYFPNQITTQPGYNCMEGNDARPMLEETYIKFYLKFENQQNSNIHAEFMRTYRADVSQNVIYE